MIWCTRCGKHHMHCRCDLSKEGKILLLFIPELINKLKKRPRKPKVAKQRR
jgi:hypothetical protein